MTPAADEPAEALAGSDLQERRPRRKLGQQAGDALAEALQQGNRRAQPIRQCQQGRARVVGHSASAGQHEITGVLMAAFNPMGIVYWLTVGAGLAADAVSSHNRRTNPGASSMTV